MELNKIDFDHFISEGIIVGVDSMIKSGKEATVFRCTANPSMGMDFVAVKVYKDVNRRNFRNISGYLDGRIGRNIRKRRDILHALASPVNMQRYWVDAEYNALVALHSAGLPVPRPFGKSTNAVAMEFVSVNDELGEPALRLCDSNIDKEAMQTVFHKILYSIKEMLAHNLIHGDLSAYNILIRGTEPIIIDFPQVVDARFNSNAHEFLLRDIENVCNWFNKKGIYSVESSDNIIDNLWKRYQRNML